MSAKHADCLRFTVSMHGKRASFYLDELDVDAIISLAAFFFRYACKRINEEDR